MCTAVSFMSDSFYFGRTLDYDCSYGESIVIVPRSFPIKFHYETRSDKHLAIIGVAHVAENYPLFYDAVNEKGLAMAGLNFVGNAQYANSVQYKLNVAQYELIAWILSRCATVQDAKCYLNQVNLTGAPFSSTLPPAELHWMIADASGAIVVESTHKGLEVYDNPAGVLTNNPEFPQQLFQLNNYMHLSNKDPENTFSSALPLEHYSRGMGGIGLPGDLSSQSRFVRAAFTKCNAVREDGAEKSVSQFFHIMGTVDQTKGCCTLANGKEECTIYTTCYHCVKGCMYYTCYHKHQISALDMHRVNLDASNLFVYPMCTEDEFRYEN